MALFAALGIILFAGYRQIKSPQLRLYNQTNTNPVLDTDKQFMAKLNQKYPDLSQTLNFKAISQGTYVIPGLKQSLSLKLTKEGYKKGVADDMVPQGLAIIDGDYIAVSAYSKSKAFYTVIWLIDKESGRYLKTIVLDSKDHLGAMTYDQDKEVLWIATEGKNKTAQLQTLTLKQLKEYDLNKSAKPISYDNHTLIDDVVKTSYMTYHEGKIYVGYFKMKSLGKLAEFKVTSDGQLKEKHETIAKPEKVYDTFSKIQGISFYGDHIFMTQSYGLNKSKLLIFKNNFGKKGYALNKGQMTSKLHLPPYLEQAVGQDDNIYLLFESGSQKYRFNPFLFNFDRILVLKSKSILNK